MDSSEVIAITVCVCVVIVALVVVIGFVSKRGYVIWIYYLYTTKHLFNVIFDRVDRHQEDKNVPTTFQEASSWA